MIISIDAEKLSQMSRSTFYEIIFKIVIKVHF